MVGTLEQHVTTVAHPQIPAFAWNDRPHGEDSYQLSAISNQGEEGQWSEVSGELVVDNPAEVQEPCVTTENEKNFQPSVFSNQKEENEPVEEIDDSDEGAHYSPRRNWKWIR